MNLIRQVIEMSERYASLSFEFKRASRMMLSSGTIFLLAKLLDPLESWVEI